MNQTSWRSVLLAVVVVGSALVGAVGPAMGQTSSTYTHTYTTAADAFVVDIPDSHSGQVNIQFTSPETGTPDGIVYATTLSTNQIENNQIRLRNMGAYDNLTVTVSGPTTAPVFTAGPLDPQPVGYLVGSTGGDADMQCGTLEEAQTIIGGQIVDCTGYPGISSINTTGTDAGQTEIDIYQDAQDNRASAQNTLSILSNYLNDTETTARIIGQNAYLRALNNGSSQPAAQTAARAAVADYYATKQRNLASTWETQVQDIEYLRGIAENESGISDLYVDAPTIDHEYDVGASIDTQYVGLGPSQTLTLTNGETTNATMVTMTVNDTSGSYGGHTNVGLTTGEVEDLRRNGDQPDPDNIYAADLVGLHVQPPNTNYETLRVLTFQEYADRWTEIEEQNNRVQNDMDTLVNNTYDAYQAGEINNTDLVDPYTLTRRSAGDEYQSWAAAQLTTMGVNSPEALDQTGAFEISTESGAEYRGILFLTEQPTGGVESGGTYDPAALNGTEYIVTANRTVELTDPFTVENITNTNDETVQNVTYTDVTYQSSNVTDLIQEYESLLQQREEIEAREQALIDNSGIAAGGGGEALVDPLVAIGAAGGLLLVVIIGNQT